MAVQLTKTFYVNVVLTLFVLIALGLSIYAIVKGCQEHFGSSCVVPVQPPWIDNYIPSDNYHSTNDDTYRKQCESLAEKGCQYALPPTYLGDGYSRQCCKDPTKDEQNILRCQ